jgi:hypothetical protein
LRQHHKVLEVQLRREQLRVQRDVEHAAFLQEWQDRVTRHDMAAADLQQLWRNERDSYLSELVAKHANFENRWEERDSQSWQQETEFLERVEQQIQVCSTKEIIGMPYDELVNF